MNGPEPMNSVICFCGSVSAMRLGIMKGTLDETLASASITKPKGRARTMANVLLSTTFTSAVSFIMSWP